MSLWSRPVRPMGPADLLETRTKAPAGPCLGLFVGEGPGWSDQQVALNRRPPMKSQKVKTFQPTDRLHVGRMARVSADGIVGTLSAWLAELDASGTMVD